jgi:hypothetical protein
MLEPSAGVTAGEGVCIVDSGFVIGILFVHPVVHTWKIKTIIAKNKNIFLINNPQTGIWLSINKFMAV